MTLASKYGRPLLEKPYREVLQRWRLCLASLLFFTIILTDNFGVSSSTGPSQSHMVKEPWIPWSKLFNYSYNSAARPNECYRNDRNCSPSSRPLSCSSPPYACSDRLTDTGDREYQCLFMCRKEELKKSVCDSKMDRSAAMNLRLPFCSQYTLGSMLLSKALDPKDSGRCNDTLRQIQTSDDTARNLYCEFEYILSRYDCHNNYSVKWRCDDCKRVYKLWVCSMLLPFQSEGLYYKPCRQFCNLVEQQCPYFLPDTKLQYAGEPSFLCMDPDIPEEPGENSSMYGEPPNCYLPCHLNCCLSHSTCHCPHYLNSFTVARNSHSMANSSTSSSSQGLFVLGPTLTLLMLPLILLEVKLEECQAHDTYGSFCQACNLLWRCRNLTEIQSSY